MREQITFKEDTVYMLLHMFCFILKDRKSYEEVRLLSHKRLLLSIHNFFIPTPKGSIKELSKTYRVKIKANRTDQTIWSRIISVSLIWINLYSLSAEKVTQKEKKSRYGRVHTRSAARVSKQWDRKTIVTQCQSTGPAKVSWHSATHAGCFLISKLMQEISRTIISGSWFPWYTAIILGICQYMYGQV